MLPAFSYLFILRLSTDHGGCSMHIQPLLHHLPALQTLPWVLPLPPKPSSVRPAWNERE